MLGLAVLTLAADQLVLGAGRVASRLRVAPVVVGVVVIGLGTSAPEFLVSGVAAARGNSGLATGNLVGSNIINLTLILGTAALIRPVVVTARVLRHEAPLTLVAMGLLAAATATGITRVDGVLLAVATGAALTGLVVLARSQPVDPIGAEATGHLHEDRPRQLLAVEVVRTVLALAGVLIGAQLLVSGATSVAIRLGAPQIVIGFTLVALGTSLPELVTAVQAQRRGEADLLIGNLLGSNLFNSLAGGAVIGLAAPEPLSPVDPVLLAAMLGVGVVAWLLLFRGRQLTRVEGVVLIVLYGLVLPLLA
jgi:cation:H+ antiporter